jgi:hypothetical protein
LELKLQSLVALLIRVVHPQFRLVGRNCLQRGDEAAGQTVTGEIQIMFRKTMIAIVAAGSMALGLGAATAPAEAKVHVWVGVTPGWGYYGHHHHRGHWHCHYKKVKVWNKHHTKKIWVTKKSCHRHRYYH